MLVLRRKEGQWTDITHKSGDIIRVRVYETEFGQVSLAFDDPARNFDIERPERVAKIQQQRNETPTES